MGSAEANPGAPPGGFPPNRRQQSAGSAAVGHQGAKTGAGGKPNDSIEEETDTWLDDEWGAMQEEIMASLAL